MKYDYDASTYDAFYNELDAVAKRYKRVDAATNNEYANAMCACARRLLADVKIDASRLYYMLHYMHNVADDTSDYAIYCSRIHNGERDVMCGDYDAE